MDGAPSSAPVIAVRGLSKRYSAAVLAVDDLSFTVERGQVCGMLGPNGAGKTTTLRMLVGLVRPTAGDTWLFGEEVRPGLPSLARVGTLIEGAGADIARRLAVFERAAEASGPLSGHGG